MEANKLYQELEALLLNAEATPPIDKECLSVILDDVVLEYLAGLLSNLKEAEGDSEEESFDEFIDVLTGYIPEFSQFDRSTLYDWLTNRLLVNVSTSQIPEPDIAVLPEDVLEKKKCCEIPLKQRNETAQYSASKHMERNGKGKCDEVTKQYIVSNYSQVSNSRFHHPVLPKEEPKKMVRYRENQVVSTRGERYTFEKTAETEEMKKTYVNLKPLRKYRFH